MSLHNERMIIMATLNISWMMMLEINMRIRMDMILKGIYDFVMRVGMIWIMLM
jgi:hypothetical protein